MNKDVITGMLSQIEKIAVDDPRKGFIRRLLGLGRDFVAGQKQSIPQAQAAFSSIAQIPGHESIFRVPKRQMPGFLQGGASKETIMNNSGVLDVKRGLLGAIRQATLNGKKIDPNTIKFTKVFPKESPMLGETRTALSTLPANIQSKYIVDVKSGHTKGINSPETYFKKTHTPPRWNDTPTKLPWLKTPEEIMAEQNKKGKRE